MVSLPDAQKQLLTYLLEFQRTRRYQPTVRELSRHFGVGVTTAKYRLSALEKKTTSRSCGMRAARSAGSM